MLAPSSLAAGSVSVAPLQRTGGVQSRDQTPWMGRRFNSLPAPWPLDELRFGKKRRCHPWSLAAGRKPGPAFGRWVGSRYGRHLDGPVPPSPVGEAALVASPGLMSWPHLPVFPVRHLLVFKRPLGAHPF